MLSARFLFSTLRNRLSSRSHHLQRFQCHGYTKQTKYDRKKIYVPPVPEEPVTHSGISYAVPGVCLLTVFGAGIFLYANDQKRSILKGHGVATDHARDNMKGPVIGGPFSVLDCQSCSVTEQDLLGKWLLFYFGYTSSPDIGPKELQKMAKAIDILESEHKVKIQPVFVTLDPQRDTPSQLKAYLKEINPRIIGLTGTCCGIRKMAQEYRVPFRKVEEDGDDYLVDTSHSMYLLDPKMEVVRVFGVEYDLEDLSLAIIKEMKKTEE